MSKWDETTAAARLRTRRRWRLVSYSIAGILLLSIVADHLRGQNRGGDDWLRFDGHPVQFVKAIDGQSIAVRDENTEDVTTVALQGIRSAGAEWDAKSTDQLDALLTGKNLILHLKPTDPRDPQGRLRADVFTEDHQLIAAELVGEGLALPDRASRSDFLTSITQKETQAKKHRLGLWSHSNS
jgi:endonuclease YncB( thermonuclease family)